MNKIVKAAFLSGALAVAGMSPMFVPLAYAQDGESTAEQELTDEQELQIAQLPAELQAKARRLALAGLLPPFTTLAEFIAAVEAADDPEDSGTGTGTGGADTNPGAGGNGSSIGSGNTGGGGTGGGGTGGGGTGDGGGGTGGGGSGGGGQNPNPTPG